VVASIKKVYICPLGCSRSSPICLADKNCKRRPAYQGKLKIRCIANPAYGPLSNSRTRQIDYYSHKTQRLLDFGVKELFWFFTGPRKVLVARPGEDWRTSDWTRELLLLNEYPFSLHDLLQQDGWQLG
jgi:hypothetical protein